MIKFQGGPFSNFFQSPIEIDGRVWQTVEHYFQAMKSNDPKVQEHIRTCKGPATAKKMGRSATLRPDWEHVKEDVMVQALRVKFKNPSLRLALLETGTSQIIEDAPWDEYWGSGKSGRGKNRLGVLLMKVRQEIAYDEE